MKKNRKIVICALVAAFTCVATLINVGPLPPSNGYIHLGDALVLFSGILLGPVYGAAASAIGSSTADLVLGYVAYAPATLIIKFLVALCMGIMYRIGSKSTLKIIISAIISEIIMVLGYYLYEAFLLGGGIGAIAALGAIPANVFQGISGVVISSLLINTFKNNKSLKKYME